MWRSPPYALVPLIPSVPIKGEVDLTTKGASSASLLKHLGKCEATRRGASGVKNGQNFPETLRRRRLVPLVGQNGPLLALLCSLIGALTQVCLTFVATYQWAYFSRWVSGLFSPVEVTYNVQCDAPFSFLRNCARIYLRAQLLFSPEFPASFFSRKWLLKCDYLRDVRWLLPPTPIPPSPPPPTRCN